ncbi:DUF6207 family protein [Streptomyces mirabilis]|uniref:DUF6207 family protein n=1 Tax=Streptomyces mirabilis TaxID=68239 RepID=UPI003404F852
MQEVLTTRWATATADRTTREPGEPGVRLRCYLDLRQELGTRGTRPEGANTAASQASSPAQRGRHASIAVRTASACGHSSSCTSAGGRPVCTRESAAAATASGAVTGSEEGVGPGRGRGRLPDHPLEPGVAVPGGP